MAGPRPPGQLRTAPQRGRCLCGAVRFAIGGAPTPIELCHCPRCRRAYGGAFAAADALPRDALHVDRSQHLMVGLLRPARGDRR